MGVYEFTRESMYEDLMGRREEGIVNEILEKIRFVGCIEIDDNYIIGYKTAWYLKERYGINCCKIILQ